MVGNAVVNLKLNKQRDIMDVHWNPGTESISNQLPLTYFQVFISQLFLAPSGAQEVTMSVCPSW